MLQSEKFGKLIVAMSLRDIGALIDNISAKYVGQIKEISHLPDDIALLQENIVRIEDIDASDFSIREFKIRMFENQLNEINEHIGFIKTKLQITTVSKPVFHYEFHIKDLEDLITKTLEKTNEHYYALQELYNKQIILERAISMNWIANAVLESLSFFDFKKDYINLSLIKVHTIVIGTVNVALFKSFLDSQGFFYYETKVAEKEHLFLIVTQNPTPNDLEEKKKLYNARDFELLPSFFQDDGTLDIDTMQLKQEGFLDERDKLKETLVSLRRELTPEVMVLEELRTYITRLLQYHDKMRFSKEFVIAEFWILLDEWPLLEKDMNAAFGDRVKYKFIPMERQDTLHEENTPNGKVIEEPPTYMHISPLLRPYTTILKLYGMPRYFEVNPLLIMAISFPLLFGLMFGDFGQGLVLIAAGLLCARRFKHKDGWHNLSLVIAWCGAGALFGGLVYGEFFGFPFEIHGFGMQLFPWFKPFEGGAMGLFTFTIWIGAIQMSVGLILKALNYILVKRKFMILVDPLPKAGILWTCWLLIQHHGLAITYFISMEFLIFTPGGIILLSFIGLLVFGEVIGKAAKLPYLTRKRSGSIIGEKSMELFETFLSFLSNAISYTRIFAMTMVHLGFMFAVRIIASQVASSVTKNVGDAIAGSVGFGIAYGIGTGLVMLLELMLVTIQNVRLHFYEFFSKFYSGGGELFTPMKYDVRFSKLYFDQNAVFLVKQQSSG